MTFLLIYLLLLQQPSDLSQTELERIRTDYTKAVDDKGLCERNISALKKHTGEALSEGYLGAYMMIMAKHAFNPISKLNWFKKGRRHLDTAIDTAPKNLEIRFLRLSIQSNAPQILNYDDQIKADRMFISQNFNSIKDNKLKTLVSKFFKEHHWQIGQNSPNN